MIVCILFFFSGFASLVFEIVFSRQLTRLLGSGMSANACVFAAFLAGCALGAYLSVRERKLLNMVASIPLLPRNCSTQIPEKEVNLKIYGRLELACAGAGIILFNFLDSAAADLIPSMVGQIAFQLPVLIDAVRFSICYFLLLIPCVCMGATYGFIVDVFAETKTCNTKLFPLFYGINTLGASGGAFVAGFILLPQLGLRNSCLLAALIYFAIFLYSEFKSASAARAPGLNEKTSSNCKSHSAAGAKLTQSDQLWLSIVFCSGFLALFLEITWTRIFSLLLGGSVYSTSVVLVVILSALGLSSLTVSLAKPTPRISQLLIAACLIDTAICLLLNASTSNYLIWSFFTVSSHIAPRIVSDPFWQAIATRAIVASVYIFPSSFFLACVLPLASQVLKEKHGGTLLYTANCMGSVLAGLTFAVFFFSAISQFSNSLMFSSLIFSAFIAATTAATLLMRFCIGATLNRKFLFSILAIACLISPCTVLIKKTQWRSDIMSAGSLVYKNSEATDSHDSRLPSPTGSVPLQFYKEGINSTVSVVLNQDNNTISFANDGKTEATLPIDPSLISPGSDQSTHILLAALPTLFHRGDVKEALLIGAGSGMSAATFLSYPNLGKLTVAELEPAVIEACKKFSQYNGGAFRKQMLATGRIELKPYDARFLLSSSRKKYDVIASQPADPWVSGAADLFTTDFWKLASSRLNHSGIFCQWLQLYAIPQQELLSLIKSFKSIFPKSILFHPPGAGELVLLGFMDDAARNEYLNEINTKLERNHTWFEAVAGIANGFDCLALAIATPEELNELCKEKQIPLSTDDMTIAEYATARSMLTASNEVEKNLSLLSKAKRGQGIAAGLGAAAMSNLARAYARQYIQDSTPLKVLNKERALSLSTKAYERMQTPLTIWQDKIIKRALSEESSPNLDATLPAYSDSDRLAQFDQAFEGSDLAQSSRILADCQYSTKKEFRWRLRNAFLLLRKNDSNQAQQEFIDLLVSQPNNLPALLGATFASLKTKNTANAQMCLTRYLAINPWDFESQRLLAILLSDAELAFEHARNSAILRPGDASAFVPLLAILSNSSNELFSKVLQNASKLAPNSTELSLVDRITKNGKHPELLLKNADFIQLVKEIQLKAEDAKSGYKILGEP